MMCIAFASGRAAIIIITLTVSQVRSCRERRVSCGGNTFSSLPPIPFLFVRAILQVRSKEGKNLAPFRPHRIPDQWQLDP